MERDDLILKANLKSVEAELNKARQRLDKYPEQWHTIEKIGRCLRAMGDPGAREYFLKAAANYNIRETDPGDCMRKGNQFRLAGEAEEAKRFFDMAHDLYAEMRSRVNADQLLIEHMIPASFLTGSDEEAIALAERLKCRQQAPHLIAFPVAKLAKARLVNDSDLAAEAVLDVISQIKRHRHHVWDTFGVLPWDWYEIAYETWAEMRVKAGLIK